MPDLVFSCHDDASQHAGKFPIRERADIVDEKEGEKDDGVVGIGAKERASSPIINSSGGKIKSADYTGWDKCVYNDY